METVELRRAARQIDDVNRFTRAGRFRNHVDGIAGDDDEIGHAEKAKIGILVGPRQKVMRHTVKSRLQQVEILVPRAARRGDQQTRVHVAGTDRQPLGEALNFVRPQAIGGVRTAYQYRDVGPVEMNEAPGDALGALLYEAPRHAIERAARGNDIRTGQVVVTRHDDEIEMRRGDDRILQLDDARAPLRQFAHQQRCRDAVAAGGDEEVRPGRNELVACGSELQTAAEANIGRELVPGRAQTDALDDRYETPGFGETDALAFHPRLPGRHDPARGLGRFGAWRLRSQTCDPG